METREQTEAREKKLVDDTKRLAQSGLRKLGINIQNPLAGLDVLPTTEESLDPTSLKIYQDANKPIEQLQGFAKEGLKVSTGLYGAALSQYGTVANQPRNMINITDQVEEIIDMPPSIYKRAGAIYKNHEGGISWKQAIAMAKLPQGTGPNDPTVYIPPDERIGTQKGDPLQMTKEDPKDYSRSYFKKKFKEVGLNKNVQLDIFDMLEQQGHTEHTRRSVKMGISNPDYSIREYKKTRKILVDEFLDGLEFLGIDKNNIEAHHVASLRQTASLFEGLPPEQFPELIKMIYDEGVFTGNDPRNLIAIQRKAHINKRKDIVSVHRYLTDELGKYGELLVGDYGSEIRELPIEKRLPYVKKFAAVVKGSHEVANTAIRQILDERAAEQDPSALANALSQIEQEEVKRAVSEYFERQRNPNYEALLESILEDPDSGKSAADALREKGFKPKKPYQFDMFK